MRDLNPALMVMCKEISFALCLARGVSAVVVLTRVCLRRLKNLTSDTAVIVESLRKSKTGLLEISEDQTKIRRSLSKPLPEYTDEYKDALKHKSIYMVSDL